MGWFKIGKGEHEDYILSPYLFNFYAECIMGNDRLDEAQAGIKIAGRNINNFRYADDTTLMAESEECREPARDIPLVTKVMRKEARHTQRRD